MVMEECLCCFDMLQGLSVRGCPNSSRHVTATLNVTTKTKVGLALSRKIEMSCMLYYEILLSFYDVYNKGIILLFCRINQSAYCTKPCAIIGKQTHPHVIYMMGVFLINSFS